MHNKCTQVQQLFAMRNNTRINFAAAPTTRVPHTIIIPLEIRPIKLNGRTTYRNSEEKKNGREERKGGPRREINVRTPYITIALHFFVFELRTLLLFH